MMGVGLCPELRCEDAPGAGLELRGLQEDVEEWSDLVLLHLCFSSSSYFKGWRCMSLTCCAGLG